MKLDELDFWKPHRIALVLICAFFFSHPASAAQEGSLLWKIQAQTPYGNAPVNSAPALGTENRVYFNCSSMLYAVDHLAHELIWQQLTVSTGGAQAVDHDEYVYLSDALCFSCYEGDVVGTGGLKSGHASWAKSEIIHGGKDYAPAVSMSGGVYTVGQHFPEGGDVNSQHPTKLFALNQSGDIKWTFDLDCSAEQTSWKNEKPISPVIGPNGVIYVGVNYCGSWQTPTAYLYAIAPNGQEKWSYECYNIQAPPAVDNQGNIFLPAVFAIQYTPPGETESRTVYSYKLVGLNNQGEEFWRPVGVCGETSPVIGGDGTIYITNNSSYNSLYELIAHQPPGTIGKWTFAAGGEIHSTPAVGSDGVIYFGCDDGKLYAVNPDGSERWTYQTGGPIRSSPIITNDGVVYVGSEDTYLHGVACSSRGLAASPWPTDRGNVYRTASAECLEAAFVNNELQFDAPCVAYNDERFAFTFRHTGNGVFEPDLSTLKASEGGPCLNIKADLSIPVFCLKYLETKYRFNLTYLDGLRWTLTPNTFREWGGY